jgi:hypothetical protein
MDVCCHVEDLDFSFVESPIAFDWALGIVIVGISYLVLQER